MGRSIDLSAIDPKVAGLAPAEELSAEESFLNSLLNDDIPYINGRKCSAAACAPLESCGSSAEMIHRYLDENYYRDISLQMLADVVFLNSKYISELFKKKYGITITGYIAQRRISDACQMLADSNMTVVEISERVGYNDPKYFTRLFKRINGLTPIQYRRLYR